MSKYNVEEEDKEQLYNEIENQGLDYWLTNYASHSDELKRYPELYDLAMTAAKAIEDVESAFIDEGIIE